MTRPILVRRRVSGELRTVKQLLTTQTHELLAAATGAEPIAPRGDGAFPLRLRGRRAGVDEERTVLATVGPVRREEHWLRMPLRWEAEGRLLPTFDGALELVDLDVDQSEVVLLGSYQPPLGALGALGDATVMDHVAQRTVGALLDQLVARLHDVLHGGQLPEVPPPTQLCVADVMTRDPAPLREDAPLRMAATVMLHAGISGAPVITNHGELVGVISERDLLDKEALWPRGRGRAAQEGWRRRMAITVGEACTRPAVTTTPATSLRDAVQLMLDRGVGRLVVLDGAELAGIVTRHDVMKALAREDDAIAADVEAVLLALDADREVDAVVSAGIVMLSGAVGSVAERHAMENRVAEVDGVIDVLSDDVLTP